MIPGTSLDGRNILITGASRGLGLAMAERLGTASAKLWLADVQAERGRAAVADLAQRGIQARFIEVDVTETDSVTAMAETIQQDGPLWGLVNNAALADNVGGKSFWEIEPGEWDRLMAVNLRGPWLVSRAVVSDMIRAGEGGRIVNVASDAAIYGSPRLAHYISSKGGVMALTRAMSRELGAHEITVNSVAPGIVETESSAEVPAERHQLYRDNRSIKRSQQPSDVVGAVAFLLSDEASYITGQTLVVNGGFVMY